MAGGALVGVLIGACTTLLTQRTQWRQQRRMSEEALSQDAVVEVTVRASTLDMASHQAAMIASSFSSLGGQLNRLIRIMGPLQPERLFDGLNREHELMLTAAAQLRLTQDEETVRCVDDILSAAAEMIAAHHALTTLRRTPLRLLMLMFAGRQRGDADRLTTARRNLHSAVGRLQEHSRRRWELPHIDLMVASHRTLEAAAEDMPPRRQSGL